MNHHVPTNVQLGRTLLDHDEEAHFQRLADLVPFPVADAAATAAALRLERAFVDGETLVRRSAPPRLTLTRVGLHVWRRHQGRSQL